MFEEAFNQLLEHQLRGAVGQRKEMLKKDLSSTKEMLKVTIWPVKKSLNGITLELELVSRSGVRIYVDAFVHEARLAMESDGFVVHAEKITRDRFAFEKMRARTIAAYGYAYVPFSRDELEKNPMECSSSFAELLGRHGAAKGDAFRDLNVYEREALRYAMHLHRPPLPEDVRYCLCCSRDFSQKVLKSLMDKELVIPSGNGKERIRKYILSDQTYRYRL